jgi:Xaa-Pro aminopeptidase
MSSPLAKIRELMKTNGINLLLVSKLDPHQSEYASPYWNEAKFVSGFTGSNAAVVIMDESCLLLTDGRYYVQAAKELEGSGVSLWKALDVEEEFLRFAAFNVPAGGTVGFDGRAFSALFVSKLEKALKPRNAKVRADLDLVGEVWEDRVSDDKFPIVDHPVVFAGKSRVEKIAELRLKLSEIKADGCIISSLDDIAWLMNLRGGDLLETTMFNAYAYIGKDTATLFVDPSEVKGVLPALEKDGIEAKGYTEVALSLKALDPGITVAYCPRKTSALLSKALEGHAVVELENDLTEFMKAKKNSVELEGLDRVNIRDGVAMVRFSKWIKETAGTVRLTELDASAKVLELRQQGECYVCPSFESISAYMANAAMMHYSPVAGKDAEIEAKGFYLLDSGAHYWDGTTDITRTYVLGPVDADMKRDFTYVLKSHIALASAKFLSTATGSNLDTLARMPMWENGLDYKCGTGHGIGFCLNVHEGPQRISMKPNPYAIEPGNILTDEPGIYREGLYGIRTENTMVAVEDETNEFGKFYRFKIISWCPIDLDGVEADLLTPKEKAWLNDYHKTVYEKLSPLLDEGEREWLKNATRAI